MVRAFHEWFFEQLAMYSAYHEDGRNRLTHYIGVPIILLSILIVLEQVRFGEGMSAAVLLLGLLVLFYAVAVPAVGLLFLLISVPLYLVAEYVAMMDFIARWALAAATFVVGWAIQFVGHVFEGRRPAFTVNMLQVFMAPAFLVAELLFAAGQQRALADALKLRARKYART